MLKFFIVVGLLINLCKSMNMKMLMNLFYVCVMYIWFVKYWIFSMYDVWWLGYLILF